MVTMYESKKKFDRPTRNNKEKIKGFNLKSLTENLQSGFAIQKIEVKVNSRNNILEIVLEGKSKPDQKGCLKIVQKRLFPLNSSHRFIKIYGTNLNNKSDRWVKEINLNNHCFHCGERVTYIFRSKKINLKFCKSCKWPLNNALSTADNFANQVFNLYRSWEKNFLNWYLGAFKKNKKNTKEISIRIAIPLIALLIVFGISWKLNYQPAYQINYDAKAPSQYFLYKELKTNGDRPTLLWKRDEGVCLYISNYSGVDRDRFAQQIKTEYAVKCVNYLD